MSKKQINSKYLNSKSQREDCCGPNKSKSGIKSGWIYGLLPHSFCIGFILASVIGSTLFMGVFKRLLLVPYFFQLLIVLSMIFASVSAVIYLNSCGLFTRLGIIAKWRYLSILYGTTLAVNLLFFWVVFPMIANLRFRSTGPTNLAIQVDIPCPGHAPLIGDELKKLKGVKVIDYQYPNIFKVGFESNQLTSQEILNLEIFKTYKAKII